MNDADESHWADFFTNLFYNLSDKHGQSRVIR